MTMPRVALLTWWAPDTRYKVIQKIAAFFPSDRLCWASLLPARAESRFAFRHAAFPAQELHWRLRKTALQFFWNERQAARLAREIAAWARGWKPEVVWVLPEMDAAGVGWHLQRELRLPLHVTVHDAHETARPMVPRIYYPFYARNVKRILRSAKTADLISGGMLDYFLRLSPDVAPDRTLVFPPSVPVSSIAGEASDGAPTDESRIRRIGFCGSMRVSPWQWATFTRLLAGLPYEVEIVAFAYADLFPFASLPPNVRLRMEPYAPTEEDVIHALRSAGVHACYLGLWKERGRRLFGRTSLSAKLTTYAAAGLPVIVDSAEDSAAWQIVNRYGAGILLSDEREGKSGGRVQRAGFRVQGSGGRGQGAGFIARRGPGEADAVVQRSGGVAADGGGG